MVKNLDTYAVLGNPVAHSLSPQIHQEFAKQAEQSIHYDKILVPIDDFASQLKDFFSHPHHLGTNVTLPFKQQAWQLVNKRSAAAELSGAVNTILREKDGSLFGDNTDGLGLLNDLTENLQLKLKNKKILILGAGGAACGSIEPLLSAQPELLFIANRTVEKAQQLAKRFESFGEISADGLNQIPETHFDLIINATSAGLSQNLPELNGKVVGAKTVCYDLVYGNAATPWLDWCKQQSTGTCYDGLGMLVEQAALAFQLWRGVMPETKTVIDSLRNSPYC